MLRTTRTTTPAAALLAATLLLAACGEDEVPEPATQEAAEESATEQPAEPLDDADAEPTGDDAAADTDATDGAIDDEVLEGGEAFDPGAEVLFKEITFTPMGHTEPLLPFQNMLLPDDTPWPATVTFVQAAEDTSEATEPVTSNNGAFRIEDPAADVDSVMGFFDARLPALGWELDEERPADDARWTRWLIDVPNPDGEGQIEVEFRIEYLAPGDNRDQGALRWWTTTN